MTGFAFENFLKASWITIKKFKLQAFLKWLERNFKVKKAFCGGNIQTKN